MDSHQALRDAKKKEAAEHLLKCIDQLRTATETHDAWPWVQLKRALTAFDEGAYDLSVTCSRLAQARKNDRLGLSEEKAHEAIKESDLDTIERYLRNEELKPAKLYPSFSAPRFDSSRK